MKKYRILNIAHLVGVTALTVAVICRVEYAMWAASCYLMGVQVGNAISDIKSP